MKDIAIFGAGGFGKEVAVLINSISKRNNWNLIGFFDDGVKKGTQVSHFGEVLGGMDELNAWDAPLDVVIAIGNPRTLKNIRERMDNPHLFFPNVISDESIIKDPQSFHMGKGNILYGRNVVSCDVTIGNYNLLNGNVVMGHDVTVGDYNIFMPRINVSGEVSIGSENLFGVGSIIIQRLKIGNHITLSAGSVLLTKPKDESLYMGNPAKRFKF